MLSNEMRQALEGSLEFVSLSLFLFLLPPASHQVSSGLSDAGPLLDGLMPAQVDPSSPVLASDTTSF